MREKIKNSWHKNIILLISFMFVIMPLFSVQANWEVENIQFDPGQEVWHNSGLGNESPVTITAEIINWFLTLLGLLAVALILYGGAVWMFSAGNEEQVTKAKSIIIGAIIGLIIILASYGIMGYVFENMIDITDA